MNRRGNVGRGRSFTVAVGLDEAGQMLAAPAQGNDFSEFLRFEIKKVMKEGSTPLDNMRINFTEVVDEFSVDEFAGNIQYPDFIDCGSWIVVTGATRHVCASLKHFTHYHKPMKPTTVHLPDGSKRSIAHIGPIKLSKHITLNHVLHIPTFSVNLLSVSQLCESLPVSFQFMKSCCVLQDQKTKKKLALGKLVGRLYTFDAYSFLDSSCTSHSVTLNSVTDTACNNSLWHKRLGHSSLQAIKHIPSLCIKPHISDSLPCDVCHLAKQHRLPFLASEYQADSIFDLVHMDIWGPYKHPTKSGCSYFLTIVDHYSRSTWTYLMKYKTQTIEYILTFLKMVETQFSCKVKVIRTDNGSEFVSSQCQSLFQNSGILHQKSCTYTPQQNGVVEHKHKHLLAVARSLLFQASLPKYFWGDCILAATYLINRIPSQILNWSTPYEKLYGKPPSYDHLRVFGCLCFSTNTIPSKTKFDPRASKCVFLGYAPGSKGFKVYDIASRCYFISRDVLFYEDIFPFSSLSTSDPGCPLPLLPVTADDAPSSTSSTDPSLESSSLPTSEMPPPLLESSSLPTSEMPPPLSPPAPPMRRSHR